MKLLDIIRHTIICFVAIIMIGAMFIGPKYALPMIMLWLLTYGLLLPREEGCSKRTLEREMEKIDAMEDGFAFERYTAELFKAMGCRASVTKEQGDFGADVIARVGKDKVAIQCKRYSNAVGVAAVYEVLGGKAYYKCNKAVVITNSTYTDAAKKLAREAHVELIDRVKLMQLISNYYTSSAYNKSKETIKGEIV